MKQLIALMLALGIGAAVSAARPVAMVQKTRFAYTPKQFRTDPSDPSALIDVSLRVEYPVQIAGVSAADTERLRRRLLEKALLLSGSATDPEASPALLGPLLKTIEEKRQTKREDGFCMAALTYEERLAVTAADARYAAVFHEGIYNEGGNGCHSYSKSEILRMSTMKPIAFGELVKDRAAYAQLFADAVLRSPAEGAEPVPESFRTEGPAAIAKLGPEEDATMLPTVRGIRFVYAPYVLTAGCCGMPTAVIPWSKLRPVCDAALLADLEALVRSR